MKIEVEPLTGADSADITIVSIAGRIDAYTVDRVEEELNSLIRIGSAKLVCDVSEVQFVSSSGFRAFRRIISSAREHEGDLKFCGSSKEVKRLFSSVGFTRHGGEFEEIDDAVEDFISPAPRDTDEENSKSGLKDKFSGLLNSVGLTRDESEDEDKEEPLEQAAEKKPNSAMAQTQILSKPSALKKTVILSPKSKDSEVEGEVDNDREHFPLIEPVRLTLYSDRSHFQNVSQLLGNLGALIGFATVEMVNLNVAVSEVCKCIARELTDEETFAIEIDSRSPGFRVSFDIPRSDYNLFENLKPSNATEVLSESEARDWFDNYVDAVEESRTDRGIRILLKLDD